MASTTPWRIRGEEVVACACVWACPCQFNALPSRGSCQAWIGFEVREGYYGDTRLDGLRVAAAYSWPGAIHEGNGTVQPVVDERATAEQRDALLTILGGQAGGTAPFEVYAAMTPNVETPLFKPIVFESDREARVARLEVEGVGKTRSEPIRNPVTGETHRVRIDLPDGFEYKQAEVADAIYTHARAGAHEFNFEHTYAQLNAFDWGNV